MSLKAHMERVAEENRVFIHVQEYRDLLRDRFELGREIHDLRSLMKEVLRWIDDPDHGPLWFEEDDPFVRFILPNIRKQMEESDV